MIALFDLLTNAQTPIRNSVIAPAAQTSESISQTPTSSEVHVKLVLAEERLESNIPERASHAAYLLGVHGIDGDEVVLQSRLDRWRKEWASRSAEADTNRQGLIERDLTYALLHGKAWKLTPERSRELKLSCVTKFCKQGNP